MTDSHETTDPPSGLADQLYAYVADPHPSRTRRRVVRRLNQLERPVLPPSVLDAMLLEGVPQRRDIESLLDASAPPRVSAASPQTVSAPASGLTKREVAVLDCVASGKTNRQIASMLVLSESTVRRHLANIFRKLGVSSRAAATAVAIERSLI